MPRTVPVAWAAVAFFLCLGFLFSSSPVMAAPAGQVIGASGEAVLESGGQRRPLKLGDAVQVGDTLDVPEGARLKLRMNDGTILSVASGSRMTVQSYTVDASGQRRDAQLSLASGLVRAVVSATAQPARFEVDTAVGTAGVRSTDWFCLVQPTGMQVGVLTGSVDMTSLATRRSVLIPARWGARLEAGRDPVPPRVWSQAEFEDVISRTDVR